MEASLATIKTNLANSSYSQTGADQQEQKALVGTITDGPPTKTVRKEADPKKRKKRLDVLQKEEEDDDKVFDFVRRFADEKHKKDNQTLESYHKKVRQDFDEKQQEYLERQQRQKLSKSETADKSVPHVKPIEDKKTVQKVPGSRIFEERKKPVEKGEGAKSEDEKLKRVKKPPVNPAAEGAKLDRKGVKYSGEKGNKTFFSKRK